MHKRLIIFSFGVFFLLAFSCKKEKVNPFDEAKDKGTVKEDSVIIPASNFAYLHEKIFKPTCANSGCHDGTFEPDFRTVSSAYNTLVNQKSIVNDANNSFEYRVNPGNPNASLMMARLTTFIPNTSGMMPLQVDPGSDWEEKKETYIQNIRDWIQKGAPNVTE